MARLLEVNDYFKGYLQLLTQLTVNTGTDSYDKFKEIFYKITHNSNHKIYVIEAENTIVGTCTLLIEPKFLRGGSYVGHIEDVVVDNNNRSYGLGSKLVEFAIEIARIEGCYKVILDCKPELVPFYSKCGLKKVGEQMGVYF